MLRLRAPAKLNLYLRVLGKRTDGYHEIETLFERIDLADELTFEPHPETLELTCSDSTLSCGEDNLILKAARRLRQISRAHHGARIHLTKRIPIAAGLGGGSSDAATTLLGLQTLWGLQLEQSQLMELAAQLGSDTPFFLTQAAFAIGRGRGEQCEPLEVATKLSHVLVCPNERLSTKEIYEHVQLDLTASKPSLTMIQHALRNGLAMAGLAQGVWNDLEPEAIRRCPIIARIQTDLHELGCLSAHVSGSGPTVVGLCENATHANEIMTSLRAVNDPLWRIEVVGTDRSTPSMIASIEV